MPPDDTDVTTALREKRAVRGTAAGSLVVPAGVPGIKEGIPLVKTSCWVDDDLLSSPTLMVEGRISLDVIIIAALPIKMPGFLLTLSATSKMELHYLGSTLLEGDTDHYG